MKFRCVVFLMMVVGLVVLVTASVYAQSELSGELVVSFWGSIDEYEQGLAANRPWEAAYNLIKAWDEMHENVTVTFISQPVDGSTTASAYATRRFEVGPEVVGAMTSVMLVAQTITNPLVGWLGDKWGHRIVMSLGALALGASAFLAMTATQADALYLAFGLGGMGNAMLFTGILSITVQFGAEHERPYYIGLGNTLVAPASILAPILGGLLVDTISYDAMFLTTTIAGVFTATILLFVVGDPRAQSQPSASVVPSVGAD